MAEVERARAKRIETVFMGSFLVGRVEEAKSYTNLARSADLSFRQCGRPPGRAT
jgi:hypothetical protein